MKTENYTPGHNENASDFMSRRSFSSHGEFFSAYLAPGLSVLDCGCGPGTITLGISERVAPGAVMGVDFGASQIERATRTALGVGRSNVVFQTADCYALPFEDASFDRVFSHALMEHLSDPVRALAECYRVLKSNGIIGVCSPDWGGFMLSPTSRELTRAIEAYTSLQSKNGGNVGVGRQLGTLLTKSGFKNVQMSARYECYPSLNFIGEYLALQLERAGDVDSAHVLRNWSQSEGGMFAQAWASAIACK